MAAAPSNRFAMHATGVDILEPGEGNADIQQDMMLNTPNGSDPMLETITDVSQNTLHNSRQAGLHAAPVHVTELPSTHQSADLSPRGATLHGCTEEVTVASEGLSASSGGAPSLGRFLPSEPTVEIGVAVKAAVASSFGGTPSLDRFLPSDPAVEIAAAETTVARWHYEPFNGLGMGIRKWPSIDAEKAGHILSPDELFDVDEEVHGDGLTFLHLADGRGWVFDVLPGRGTMCVRAMAGL